MAITASVRPESGRILYAGSDFPHPFQFRFSKEGMGHAVQNRPGSHLDGLARVWLNSSALKASWCSGFNGPGFWPDSTGPLPVSHFQTRFRSSIAGPDNIIQNQPGYELVLADCARLWPNGSGPEESQCATIIRARFWPMPLSRSGPDPACLLDADIGVGVGGGKGSGGGAGVVECCYTWL